MNKQAERDSEAREARQATRERGEPEKADMHPVDKTLSDHKAMVGKRVELHRSGGGKVLVGSVSNVDEDGLEIVLGDGVRHFKHGQVGKMVVIKDDRFQDRAAPRTPAGGDRRAVPAGPAPDPNQPQAPANTSTSPNKQGPHDVPEAFEEAHETKADHQARDRAMRATEQPEKSTAQVERDRGMVLGDRSGDHPAIEEAKKHSGHAPNESTLQPITAANLNVNPGDRTPHPAEADEATIDTLTEANKANEAKAERLNREANAERQKDESKTKGRG